MELIAPKIGGATLSDGSLMPADHSLSGGPSVLFDTVAVLASEDAMADLTREAAAVNWVRDAFGHLKVIAYSPVASALLQAAGIEPDEGTISLDGAKAFKTFIGTAREGRRWEREPTLRSIG